MKVIILGSGTGVPLSYRASPSLAIFSGDNPVLFDMGPGTLRQLARIGINHERFEQIFITIFIQTILLIWSIFYLLHKIRKL